MGGVFDAVIGAIGFVAVDPAVTEIECVHDAVEVVDVVGAVCGGFFFDGIIGPGCGIFEVPDLVAEGGEAEEVLDVVPGDAAEGVLSDEAGDEDAHAF